jgi:dihydrofolate reductase
MELIVAITNNFVIGSSGDMPWHLPADLLHFKKITSGNTIVMGRRTWDSIGRALPNRLNVVLTRQSNFRADGARVITELGALKKIDTLGVIFVIGGGELYRLAMSHVEKMHITRIDTTIEGDTFFPTFDVTEWTLEKVEARPKDSENAFDLSFETWVRGT